MPTNERDRLSDPMLRTLPGLSLRLLALVLTLGLGACAETVTSDQATSVATLRRGYDKTLTKAEKDAVISDLQSAKAKQQDEASQEGESTEQAAGRVN